MIFARSITDHNPGFNPYRTINLVHCLAHSLSIVRQSPLPFPLPFRCKVNCSKAQSLIRPIRFPPFLISLISSTNSHGCITLSLLTVIQPVVLHEPYCTLVYMWNIAWEQTSVCSLGITTRSPLCEHA